MQLSIATNTATLANANRDKKKRAKPFTTEDFMPKLAIPKTWQEIKAKMQTIARMFGVRRE